jgi:ABC-type transport system substrate-binding protein
MTRRAAFGMTLVLLACTNNPYRSAEVGKNYLYASFREPPKKLDPARSYSSDEYTFIQQIYEPPLQYHLFKRPYQLIPLTAKEVPKPEYFDKEGRKLGEDPPVEEVARAVYTIRIRNGIRYQSHPCFARDASGSLHSESMTDADLKKSQDVHKLPWSSTKELVADDYVWQIKRLAHPVLDCPILSTMENLIEGLQELKTALAQELGRIRSQRRKEQGALYNQERDEKENPIFLDLDKFELKGVERVDSHTYRIALKQKYPQMAYWLAMPFFAPVPREADFFFSRAPVVAKNWSLNNRPLGTGAYRMEKFDPHREIVLTRNENYRGDPYPSEGTPADREAGYLDDAGKTMPFVDKAIYKQEKESIPRWTKFMQGYYDASAVGAEVFDQTISITAAGAALTDDMKKRNIRLVTEVVPTIYYYAFNMNDPEVGGLSPEKKKLRRAISIVLNMEGYIEVFRNGRDVPAHGPIPQGIFGYEEGEPGINPFIYDWDGKAARRKSIEEARNLLAEAGYPGGRGRDGKPFVLYYDTYSSAVKQELDWLMKKLQPLGIDLQNRHTDYNRFRDKVRKGNFQMLNWGWHADYPDPENFLFLLYGPNAVVKTGGENSANYENPEFDALFKKMESMENGPDRREIIRKAVRIVQEDTPWIPTFFLGEYTLLHGWYHNARPLAIGGGTLKYRRIDPALREKMRTEWNSPKAWPILLLVILVALTAIPAVRLVLNRDRRSAVR